MVDSKLVEVGRLLDVTEGDIRCMGRRGVAGRFVAWIVAPIIAVLVFVLGFFAGRVTCPVADMVTSTTSTLIPVTTTITTTTSILSTTTTWSGYPYAAMALPVVLAEEKRSRVAVFLASAIVFLLAFKANPVFGQAIRYGVFSNYIRGEDTILNR